MYLWLSVGPTIHSNTCLRVTFIAMTSVRVRIKFRISVSIKVSVMVGETYTDLLCRVITVDCGRLLLQ